MNIKVIFRQEERRRPQVRYLTIRGIPPRPHPSEGVCSSTTTATISYNHMRYCKTITFRTELQKDNFSSVNYLKKSKESINVCLQIDQ